MLEFKLVSVIFFTNFITLWQRYLEKIVYLREIHWNLSKTRRVSRLEKPETTMLEFFSDPEIFGYFLIQHIYESEKILSILNFYSDISLFKWIKQINIIWIINCIPSAAYVKMYPINKTRNFDNSGTKPNAH